MLKKIFLIIITALSFTVINPCHATEDKVYVSGISNGFPPYQFKNRKGEAAGFDAEVIRMLFQEMEKELTFQQMKWEDVIGTLMFTNRLDCVTGMEINDARKKHFNFTSPYYFRKSALFIRSENNSIKQLEDLVGKTIAGDKGSYLEALLEKKGIRKNIRIKQTKSKEESMRLLKAGKFSAMIAPKWVGLYLAKKLQVEVKIVTEAKLGTPVAIAVKKGNVQLLNMLENRLQILIKEGEIYKLQQDWSEQHLYQFKTDLLENE